MSARFPRFSFCMLAMPCPRMFSHSKCLLVLESGQCSTNLQVAGSANDRFPRVVSGSTLPIRYSQQLTRVIYPTRGLAKVAKPFPLWTYTIVGQYSVLV